jgi:hypothetical protein
MDTEALRPKHWWHSAKSQLQNGFSKRIKHEGLGKFDELQGRPRLGKSMGNKVCVIAGRADHFCLIGPSVLSTRRSRTMQPKIS